MRKIWDFHGGVHPPENKTQTSLKPIADIPLPSELVIPLNQHIGSPSVLSVQVGDKVLKGQLIAEAQGYVSTSVHASSSGTIKAIELRPSNHSSGQETLCAVIEPDGKEQWIDKVTFPNWKSLEKSQLIDIIRDSGIAGMGGAGFPTAVKLNPRADHHIDTLILNGTECEPYITADDLLMQEKAEEIILGAEILSHLLGEPETVLIGIEDNKPEALKIMTEAATRASISIEVVSFPTKYPSGGEKQLIQILTGKEVPQGKIPADIGIVLQNIGTARAVHRAVEHGEPLIDRVTTIVGESLNVQQNVHALIGTPVQHILDHHGFDSASCARLIIGGPMMGYTIENSAAPIIKTTNCVLVPSRSEMPDADPQQACIRCGMCAEACPASLLPQQLYWFSRSENYDHLRSHNLFDCIECGACSFVCPSNIPLVQYYRASKGAIRHHDEEKRKAEHSRKRFEFRQERIEKAEAEKEAKRQARKKAAEAAKAKLANATPAETKATSSTAKKAEPSAPVDPQKARAKLERALTSAQSRVERAIKSLSDAKEEALDDARIESLSARVKQAEQKAAEAEKKLKEFDAQNTLDSANNSSDNKTSNGLQASAEKIKAKQSQSSEEKLKATIVTLEKRIGTAKQKLSEAEASGAATVDALKLGVTKLEEKLAVNKKELEELSSSPAEKPANENELAQEQSAADLAIAKAKARAEELASMSPEQKAAAQRESLQKRLDKAKARLEKAEAENDANIDAFKAGVDKLEAKLATMENEA